MSRRPHPDPARRAGRRLRAAGFTLVELLVAVTIGMALVLAITLMLTRYESGRRSLTGLNAASMGGAYVSYTLDRLVRSAGSGYSQSWRDSFGCRLLVQRAGSTVLPRASAFPAPFAAVPQAVRLAPVVVHAGIGTDSSDVIAFATGSSGLGESALPVQTASATAAGLRVPATVGLRDSDLVLVFENRATDCLLQQVAAGFAGGADQQLDFGGSYASATIGGIALDSIGVVNRGWVVPLGNVTGSQPQFQLIGVGADATLVSHDLLQLGGAADSVQALADGVADLRARYGVDTNGDNVVDAWQDPAVGDWRASQLLDGTEAARERLSQIVALRVGVIVRTSSPERDTVAPDTLTMFSDLGTTLEATRTLSPAERLLRWRTLEFTVPLRNALLSPP